MLASPFASVGTSKTFSTSHERAMSVGSTCFIRFICFKCFELHKLEAPGRILIQPCIQVLQILQMLQMLQMMYPCVCGLLAAFDVRTVPPHSLIVRERSSGGRNARPLPFNPRKLPLALCILYSGILFVHACAICMHVTSFRTHTLYVKHRTFTLRNSRRRRTPSLSQVVWPARTGWARGPHARRRRVPGTQRSPEVRSQKGDF